MVLEHGLIFGAQTHPVLSSVSDPLIFSEVPNYKQKKENKVNYKNNIENKIKLTDKIT